MRHTLSLSSSVGEAYHTESTARPQAEQRDQGKGERVDDDDTGEKA
jgi:hypothetical protein